LSQGTWRPGFQYNLSRWLRLYFNWKKPLDQITPNDIMVAVEAIAKPSERDHAFQSIRAFFRWTVPRHLKHSPCNGLQGPPKSEPRSRVLSDQELRKVWFAAEQMGGSFGKITQCLILIGLRRQEAASIQTSWITTTTQPILNIPSTVTKNAKELSLPLGDLSMHIVHSAMAEHPSGLLFPSPSGTIFNSWHYAEKLWQLTGIEGATIHDLRRTYCTNLGRLGVALHVIEKLVNHVSGSISGVAATYNRHSYMPEMIEATARYDRWFRDKIAHGQEGA
jgi:integrase